MMCLRHLLVLVLMSGLMLALPAAGVLPMAAHADDGGDGGGGDGGGGGGGGGSDGGGGDPDTRWGKSCTCPRFTWGCQCWGSRRSARSEGRRRPASVRSERENKTRGRAVAQQASAPSSPVAASRDRTREVVVANLDPNALAQLTAQGYLTLGRFDSQLLGTSVTRLRIPSNISVRRSLTRIPQDSPGAIAVRNDLYRRTPLRSFRAAGETCGDKCPHFEITSWSRDWGACSAAATVGVIDTAVDLTHPALSSARIEIKVTRSSDRPASDAEHGTGVVSLLAGGDDASVLGLARSARILAVDAFHRNGTGNIADVFDLIASLDWLTEQGAQTVNLSLSGPDNGLFSKVVEKSLARGITLIAAAGLPDSRAEQGYPGRYAGVVAVSAVDSRMRPSRLSARGSHILFAAPGSGLVVASARGGLRQVDGTSFATPFVTAAYAVARSQGKTTDEVTSLLASSARDLGAPGRDPIFGWGVVQFAKLPRC